MATYGLPVRWPFRCQEDPQMQACPRLNVVTDVGKLGITQTSAITGFRSAVDVEKEVT